MSAVPAGARADVGSVQVAPRSRLYALLREVLLYPDGRLDARLTSGQWRREVAAAAVLLPYPLSVPGVLAEAPPELEQMQVEYSRLFYVGPGGPPCSLSEGHHESDRLRVMEETLRFYDFFGLSFDRSSGFLPDDLVVELEFMEHLAGHEDDGGDAASFRRAQRDFLERHLCRWVPRVGQAVEREARIAYYRAVFALIADFLDSERRYVSELVRGA